MEGDSVRSARGRQWRLLQKGSSALIDQVLSSGSGLLLIVLVARGSSAATFGAVSIAMIVHGFLLGCVRALVCEVALIRSRRHDDDLEREAGVGILLTAGFGLLCLLGLVLIGWQVGGDAGRYLQLVGLTVPFVYVQDLLRYEAYGAQRVGRAVLLDGVWLGVQALVSGVLLIADRETPVALFVAWTVGAAASAAVGCALQPRLPSARGLGHWIRTDGARATSFLGDFVVSTGMVQASFLLLGAVLPLTEFGQLRLAMVSISPLANVMAGVRVLTLAHLAGVQRSPTKALVAARRVGLFYAGIAVAYGAVLYLTPTGVGVTVFGPTWRTSHTFVAVAALAEVFRLSSFPAIDFLKVFASPAVLVRTRLPAAAGVVSGILVGGLAGGPFGAVVGVALAMAAASMIWWSRVGRVEHAARLRRRLDLLHAVVAPLPAPGP